MKANKEILIVFLFIFSLLISLSAVEAQDPSNLDLTIQDSSLDDISEISTANDDGSQEENVEEINSLSAVLESSDVGSLDGNPSEDIIESSHSVDKYTKSNDDDEVLGDDPIIYVEIDENPEVQIYVEVPSQDFQIIVYPSDVNIYTVSGNTFADIQNAVNQAYSGDVVRIPSGYYTGNGTPIVISKHITVEGLGKPTLDAQNLSKILIVSDGYGDVCVNGINFINGYVQGNESHGGAIEWGGARGIIDNCNFENNHADGYAGAILFKHYDCQVRNCNFVNNSATEGGAILSANDRLTITNCNFKNNHAGINNSAGAVYICGDNSAIRNSRFENNFAYAGGAIRWDALGGSLSGSTFVNNNASCFGGAIFWKGSNGHISGSSFQNNLATKYGGAIVWFNGSGVLENSNFVNNRVTEHAGAVLLHGANFNVSGSTFGNNHADEFAGAVLLFADNSTLSDSTFENNSANYDSGAIHWLNDNGTLKNSTFVNNSANIDASALRWDGNYGILSNSTFKNNHAERNAAVRWIGPNGQVLDSTFVNNSAKNYAGALFLDGNNSTILNSSFENNSADNYGGAIFGLDDNAYIDNCSFIHNNASKYGGAIFWSQLDKSNICNATIRNSNFDNNYAPNATIVWNSLDESDTASIVHCSFKKDLDAKFDFQSYDLTLKFVLDGIYNYTGTSIGLCNKESLSFYNGGYTSYSYSRFPTLYATITTQPYCILEIINGSNNAAVYNATTQLDAWGSMTYDYRNLPDGQYLYRVYTVATDEIPYALIEGSFERHHEKTYLSISVSDANYQESPIATVTASSPGTYTIAIGDLSYSVYLSSSDIENGGGKATKTVTISPLDADNYVATVNYQSNDYYEGGTNQTTFTVYKVAPSIDVNETRVYYNNDAVLDYILSESVVIDSVTIKKGADTLVEGTDYNLVSLENGRITLRGLAEGVYTVSITTLENNNYLPNTKEISLFIDPIVDLVIVQSVSNQTPNYGDTFAYTITVTNNGPSTATNVIVSEAIPNGMNVSSSDVNYLGNGVWNISSIGVGSENAVTLTLYATVNTLESLTNEINIISDEFDNNMDNNKAGITVNPIPVSNLIIDCVVNAASSVKVGDLIDYTITVVNEGPNDAPNVKVTGYLSSIVKLAEVTVSTGTYNSSTNVWDIGDLAINTPVTLALTVQAIASGNIENSFSADSIAYDLDDSDNVFIANSIPSERISTKIESKGMTTTAIDTAVDGKKGQYFSITLKDSNNNPLASKTVQITLNKVVYKVKTNSNGVAKLQINLKKAGTYTASIKFAGDSKYLGTSGSAKIKVNKQKPKLISSKKTFKVKANTKKVTATLKTSRGKILKNKKILFTINGKKYSVKTNAKGIATANIKLTKKGTFTCSIKYAGDTTYSAITKKISVVLK